MFDYKVQFNHNWYNWDKLKMFTSPEPKPSSTCESPFFQGGLKNLKHVMYFKFHRKYKN